MIEKMTRVTGPPGTTTFIYEPTEGRRRVESTPVIDTGTGSGLFWNLIQNEQEELEKRRRRRVMEEETEEQEVLLQEQYIPRRLPSDYGENQRVMLNAHTPDYTSAGIIVGEREPEGQKFDSRG